VLQYGLVSKRAMVAGCVGLYAVAVGLGLFFVAERGLGLLAIGALGVALSLAYAAPPLRLVHRGLGEPVTALGFGPVMAVGTYFSSSGRWSWQAVLISIPVGILIALVLYVNQVPDRAGDAVVGKRTLVVRWTPGQVRTGYLVAVGIAFASIVGLAASGVTPRSTLIALAALPLVRPVWRGLGAHYDDPYALIPAMQANIALHFVTGVLLVLGYVIALAG
jgi:1,4-dihydroxy-2-naphthoate octaprenyltransferase